MSTVVSNVRPDPDQVLVDIARYAADYKIDSAEFTAGMLTNTATFNLSKPNNGWPIGKYRVDVTIDGKPAGSEKFEIEAAE